MSKAQRVGNIYFADFGAGTGQASREAGFEHLALRPPDALAGDARIDWLDQVAEWAKG